MRALVLLLAFLAVSASAPIRAQEIQLQVPGGFLHAGLPIGISITVSGFEEAPAPEVGFPAPTGGRLVQTRHVPKVSSSVTIVNGRISQTRKVHHVFVFSFSADEPGGYTVGPFTVKQGTRSVRSESVDLILTEVPLSEHVRIRLLLPERPVYPGERVPIGIEWSIARSLRDNLNNYSIFSTLFDRGDLFQFIDEPYTSRDSTLQIETPSGRVELKASATKRNIRSNQFLVYRAERTLIPLKPGEYELEPARVVVDEVTRWARRGLGGRRPIRSRKLRAEDERRKIVVRPVPLAGRPASFAGAVGRGFSIEARADRSVVQAGDPISMTIELRGEGNLESARLPNLIGDGGLPAEQFRLPSSDIAGRLEDGVKRFRVQLRAMDPRLREIPAISYSYFDPEEERFETVNSRPIALSVGDAPLVGADDVVGGVEESPETIARLPKAERPRVRLTAADLAIVTDAQRLLREPGSGWLPSGAVPLFYLLPSALLGLAIVGRRRRDVDPREAERQRALREGRRAIVDAAAQPRVEAVAAIVAALRSMRRVAARAPEGLSLFEAECESIVYAPGAASGAGSIDGEFHRRALELADQLAGES